MERPRAAWNWEFWLGHSRINSDKRGELLAAGIGSGMIEDRRREWLWDLRLRGTWLPRQYASRSNSGSTGISRGRSCSTRARWYSAPKRPRCSSVPRARHAARGSIQRRRTRRCSCLTAGASASAWPPKPDGASSTRRIAARVQPRWSIRGVALRVAAGARSLWRVSWGQFHQQDLPHELALADGITAIERAQRTEQAIIGFEHQQRKAAWRGAPRHLPSCSSIRERVTRTRLDALAHAARAGTGPGAHRTRALRAARTWNSRPSRAASPGAGGRAIPGREAFDELSGHRRRAPRSWDQRHAFSGGSAVGNAAPGASAARCAQLHSGWPTTRLLVRDAAGSDAR